MRRFAAMLAPVILAAGVATSMAAMGCRKSTVDAKVRWHEDVDVAEASAKAQHKRLLVFFGATWDASAKELEHTTFADAEVRFLLARDYVPVYVDISDDDAPSTREVTNRFRVIGEPTIIIVSADGKTELLRFTEYIRPEPFARALVAATKQDRERDGRRGASVNAPL